MTTTRQRLVGLAATTGLYLIAAAITMGIGHHPLRPLYEGIGPSPPYRWVHPPSAFRSTNVPPVASSTESIALASEQKYVFGSGTYDGQLVLSLSAGSVPPRAGQGSVDITIAAKDPVTLGPLPAGVYSDGNAYLVTATYQPSKARIPDPLKPMDVVIRTPVSSTELLFSSGGDSWMTVPDHHIPGQTAVASTVAGFGYILAASNVPVVARGTSRGSSLLIVGALGLAAVSLVGISVWWRRGSRPGRGKAGRRRHPPT
jgi:hypothetical protein